MRISESKRRRLEFYDRIKKKLRALIDKFIDILARPVEAFDNWMDRYDRGYEDGLRDGVTEMVKDELKFVHHLEDKYDIIIGRCNHIEAVISEMELNYPELHTEVDSIEKSLQEIRRQVR